MKIEQAAKEYASGSEMELLRKFYSVTVIDFKAGAKFITDRCYDKERIQKLFSYLCETTGHAPLESDMHEIIHILTSEQYEEH